MSKYDLAKQFKASLISDSSDLLTDYLELGLDTFTESIVSSLAQDIPFIGSLVTLCKSVYNVKTIIEIRNFIHFFDEIRRKNIDAEDIQNHIDKLEKSKKSLDKEIQYLITHISSCEDEIKTRMIALIYVSYLKEPIPYFILQDSIKIVTDIYITDLYIFTSLYKREYDIENGSQKTMYIGNINSYEGYLGINRLKGLGLLTEDKRFAVEFEDESILLKTLNDQLFPTKVGLYIYDTTKSILFSRFNDEESRKNHGLE